METLLNESLNQIAEVELIYKTKVKCSERPSIKSSKDGYDLFIKNWDENKIEFVEQFKVLLLNKANRVLGIYEVSSGGITGTVADPRLIYTAALKANACQIMMSHNHPSGSLKPSQADELLTQKIKQAGQLLDIRLLDHLIISSEGFFPLLMKGSFKALLSFHLFINCRF
jgi:DNA repair protein RadC